MSVFFILINFTLFYEYFTFFPSKILITLYCDHIVVTITMSALQTLFRFRNNNKRFFKSIYYFLSNDIVMEKSRALIRV